MYPGNSLQTAAFKWAPISLSNISTAKKYEDLIIESVGVIGRLGLLASGCPRMRGKLELFGFKFSNFILRM